MATKDISQVPVINEMDNDGTIYVNINGKLRQISHSFFVRKNEFAESLKYKGTCEFSNLPTENNVQNDTFYVTDEKCMYTCNGEEWQQSSIDEADYLNELNTVKSNTLSVSYSDGALIIKKGGVA